MTDTIRIPGAELRNNDLVFVTGRWTRLTDVRPAGDGHFRAVTADGGELLGNAESLYDVVDREEARRILEGPSLPDALADYDAVTAHWQQATEAAEAEGKDVPAFEAENYSEALENCAHGLAIAARRQRLHVAMIEWSSDREPNVFVGLSWHGVARAAAEAIRPELDGGTILDLERIDLAVAELELTDELLADADGLGDWHDRFRQAVTVPWVTFTEENVLS